MSDDLVVKITTTGPHASGKTTLLKDLQRYFSITYKHVETSQLSIDENGEYLIVVLK